MAQFYTLEEAARVLGMSSEELKAKAQSREVRAFLDGGSWRFRVVDVDELARRRGLGSDAELRLSDLEVPAGSGSVEMQDLDLSEFQMGVAKSDLGAQTTHGAKITKKGGDKSSDDSGSDHDILLDDLTLPPSQITGSSSVIIGAPSPSGRLPSDSDVRLVPDSVKGSSDSDVQLASPTHKPPSDSDVTLIKEDTADHGVIRSGSSSDTSVRPSPMLGSSAEVPASPSSDSDFELNPSSELIDALQPDSGSDFELSALDASDEFEATPLSKASDSDVTASDPKLAGINLSRPSDSGINLQTGDGLGLGQGGSIELAPLSDEELKSTAPPAKPSKPKRSLSATPPPAVKKGEKDIFDDTDFEVDVPLSDSDSDDKTVQLEAASDFDLEDSDTGSEVFAIDEEGVDQNASTAMAPSAFAEDEEEDDGFDSAVSSEMSSAWSSTDTSAGADRAAPALVLAREAEPEWSGLWVGLLAFTTLCLFLASFVAHDLVRNLYEFQSGGTAGSGLVRLIAGLFGGS
jgi:hypothetical protein